MFLDDDLACKQAAAMLAIRIVFGRIAELKDPILDFGGIPGPVSLIRSSNLSASGRSIHSVRSAAPVHRLACILHERLHGIGEECTIAEQPNCFWRRV